MEPDSKTKGFQALSTVRSLVGQLISVTGFSVELAVKSNVIKFALIRTIN